MNDKRVIKLGKIDSEAKKVVELFISKRTMMEFEYYTQRVEYINKKYNKKVDLWISSSTLINPLFIKNSFKDLDIVVVRVFKKELLFFLKKVIKKMLLLIKSFDRVESIKKAHHLVTLASDEINLNTSKRHFHH